MLIDTHCHLDFPPLSDDLPAVLMRAEKAGIKRFVVPGVSAAGWQGIAALAQDNPGMYPAFGLHPMHADQWSRACGDTLVRYLSGACAVGEIGLDYTLESPCREVQQSAFRAQLQLSVAAGLPVLIHCRKAFADLLRILREERVGAVGGVMHAFSGSPETAQECIRLGLYISVCGTITYDTAIRPVQVVRSVPLSRLVLETDAPDLSPQPYRGRPNEPAFLLETARKVAAIKGISPGEVAAVTGENAARVFHLEFSTDIGATT